MRSARDETFAAPQPLFYVGRIGLSGHRMDGFELGTGPRCGLRPSGSQQRRCCGGTIEQAVEKG